MIDVCLINQLSNIISLCISVTNIPFKWTTSNRFRSWWNLTPSTLTPLAFEKRFQLFLKLCRPVIHIQIQWDVNIWTPQYFGMVTINLNIAWLFCWVKQMKSFVTFLYNWMTQSLSLIFKISMKVYFLMIIIFFFHLLIVNLNYKLL